jgi:hypothetical protein
MAIITLAEWKTYTGTTGTTYDTQVSALIPIVQADFVEMCNFDFNQNTTDEAFPTGCKLYVAKMISSALAGLGDTGDRKKSESIDGYSYSLDSVGAYGYPPALEKAIQSKWRYAGFKGGQNDLYQYRDKRRLSPEALCK